MKNFASQLPREKYWPTLEFQIEDTGSKKNLTRLKKIYQSTLCLSLTAVTLGGGYNQGPKEINRICPAGHFLLCRMDIQLMFSL